MSSPTILKARQLLVDLEQERIQKAKDVEKGMNMEQMKQKVITTTEFITFRETKILYYTYKNALIIWTWFIREAHDYLPDSTFYFESMNYPQKMTRQWFMYREQYNEPFRLQDWCMVWVKGPNDTKKTFLTGIHKDLALDMGVYGGIAISNLEGRLKTALHLAEDAETRMNAAFTCLYNSPSIQESMDWVKDYSTWQSEFEDWMKNKSC